MKRPIRNVAIIAHVDHGKTTLVDKLLQQSGTFRENQQLTERVMDSNDLERERGITILAKNCAVDYEGTHINIVDTPGHADFGGEVERVLSMVDGVLLLVDAVEGPMPQTRFVTRKALAQGLKPIVVVNKIDRPGARPDWVVNHTFDLFDKLGAAEEQLDFPVIYASALHGYAGTSPDVREGNLKPLFDAILAHVRVRDDDPDKPLQLQICSLDYSSYVGKIGIGRISRGRLRAGQEVLVMHGPEGAQNAPTTKGRINQVLTFKGLERQVVDEAIAGDIVLVNGIDDIGIGCTITPVDFPDALPLLKVDEPTLMMNFQVNTSPLAGREGKYVTSRQLRERLQRELKSNVAMRMRETDDEQSIRGRRPRRVASDDPAREHAARRLRDGGRAAACAVQGSQWRAARAVRNAEGRCRRAKPGRDHGRARSAQGRSAGHAARWQGRVRLEYRIPARGLIGFQGEFMTLTRGTGLMSHVFDDYGPVRTGEVGERRNGVLISQDDGEAVAYALWKLQERGRMFVSPGDKLYEGMIIGINSRDNDLVVNPVREKKLTNVRASGKDEHIDLVTPIALTLESAVEFIADDELVEITPQSIRLRKRYLKEHERKRAQREAA